MPKSAAEREIRDALVAHLRATIPEARIIHELDACENRMDVAAVTTDRLYAFEIKSERDTLDRLERQMRRFAECSHHAVAVLHERFFDRAPYRTGEPRFVAPEFGGGHAVSVWSYPQNAARGTPQAQMYRWRLPVDRRWYPRIRTPQADPMLSLLHREELMFEASAHGVGFRARDNMEAIKEAMTLDMTGRHVVAAVCRQLRARTFAYADPPIFAPVAA